MRQIAVPRRVKGSSFTAKRLCVATGLCYNISDVTVRRCLYEHGYGYRRARKKRLLPQKDLALRIKFCRKVKRTLSEKLWEEGISFYLDGTGFTHKSNPYDQARSSMAWRKRNEGLSVECTTKGSHEGSGGKVANFFVAIAYEKGWCCVSNTWGMLMDKCLQILSGNISKRLLIRALIQQVNCFFKMATRAKTVKNRKPLWMKLDQGNFPSHHVVQI